MVTASPHPAPTRKARSSAISKEKRTATTRPLIPTGFLITDFSFRPIAIDDGALEILKDLGALRDTEHSLTIPREIAEAINGFEGKNLTGVHAIAKGAKASYRCLIYSARPHWPSSPDKILAVHFQRSLTAEDAIEHIAGSNNLTTREIVVLRGLSNGLTSKEIAIQMKISPNTVKSYIRLMMVRIHATTRSGIVGKLLESLTL